MARHDTERPRLCIDSPTLARRSRYDTIANQSTIASPMPTRSHYISLDSLGLSTFEGEVLATYARPEFTAWLHNLPNQLASTTEDQLIFKMRNRVYRLPCPLGTGELCIKAFKKPDRLRSAIYKRRGSKAKRAHQYAHHLYEQSQTVAEPIGYIEEWQGSQLVQSYLISRYLDESSDFYSEMAYIINERPYAGDFIKLIRTVAYAVRAMHDSGFIHGDLGPQNILMQRFEASEWSNVSFIDLNRGYILDRKPTLKERAKDLDRMKIPSHFRHIFYQIYFGDCAPPETFLNLAQRYYSRFQWHQDSRNLRHPIRTLKRKITGKSEVKKKVTTGVPPLRDTWVWDEYSAQPSVVLTGKERRNERSKEDIWLTLKACVKQARPIYKAYKEAKQTAFTRQRDLRLGLGVSVEVDEHFDAQRKALAELPNQSLLIRCYFHLEEAHWATCIDAISQLKVDGHSVSLALIQDRKAILHPEQWEAFVSKVLSECHQALDCVEVGHAINRVKWGMWNLEEMGRLWRKAGEWKAQYPGLTFLGPAVNDFEFQYYPPLLENHKEAFDAVSGHLYVDRRGAPENAQSGFSTLEKSLLASAIAHSYGKSAYYITEVNWPLENTGLYSPIAGAYIRKDGKESTLHVSEEMSASYMVRYALITLCSGATQRIWWWRLAHQGFGLIDNTDGWRPRPGWRAYVTFQERIQQDKFLAYQQNGAVHLYEFETFTIVYSQESTVFTLDSNTKEVQDLYGERITPSEGNRVTVGESPFYLMR